MACTREQYNRVVDQTAQEMREREPVCDHEGPMLTFNRELYCAMCGKHLDLDVVEPRP